MTRPIAIPRYTIIDRNNGEKFATTDFETAMAAERRRNELALSHEDCDLRVARIDDQGRLHELCEACYSDPCECLQGKVCAYCEEMVYSTEIPAIDDDSVWAKIASEHTDDCEWVKTRAHRIEQ